jgi:two-component system, OmpR family, sensor histidine kinase KdpD
MTALAFAGSFALDAFVPNAPDLLFLSAVAITGWAAGFGPALIASAVGAILLDYYFEAPQHSLWLSDPQTLLDGLAFLLVAILIGSLNARLTAAQRGAERKQLAAEDAVRGRDQALATVSHDLRTPVTVIMASASALQNSGSSLPEATRQLLLGNITIEASRLEHRIADVLALGQLDAGVAPRLEATDVSDVVSAALDRLMPLLEGRTISFDVPDTLPPVRCDAALVQKVLSNLLDNIAVHTPPNSPVGIAGRADGQWLYLTISDAGPGVPKEARERIFQKFERLDREGRGVGLGLALARAASEAQCGRLFVEDSSWGGARFVLMLPIDGTSPTSKE